MQKLVFRGFLVFGMATVLLAFAGGGWVLFRSGGGASNLFGALLLFLGLTLALMLGSLFYIERKQKNA